MMRLSSVGTEKYKEGLSLSELEILRSKIEKTTLQILELLNERGKIAQEIGKLKEMQGVKRYDPVQERKLFDLIAEHNEGPFETSTVQHIFKQIFKASLELQEDDNRKALLVSRKKKPENTVVSVLGEEIGNGTQHFIMGPCAVESYDQVKTVAQAMKKQGLTLMRGGAYKPRSSPYDFQGLGLEGLKILKQVGEEEGMAII